jgi:hypothetical protein
MHVAMGYSGNEQKIDFKRYNTGKHTVGLRMGFMMTGLAWPCMRGVSHQHHSNWMQSDPLQLMQLRRLLLRSEPITRAR